MEVSTVIQNIKTDEYDLDSIESIKIKNYNGYKLIPFEHFIKEYICRSDLDIEFINKLIEYEYEFQNQYYFFEFGNSTQILKRLLTQDSFPSYVSTIKIIGYYYNFCLFDKFFSLRFNTDDEFFDKIIRYQSLEVLIEKKIIKKNIYNNLEFYSFDPNNEEYDQITLARDSFEYDDSDNMVNKLKILGDIRIIKLYEILFTYGYQIKNNIVFYILCWHISWLLADTYITVNELNIINQLINQEEFQKFIKKDSILISTDDFGIIKRLYINEINIKEKLEHKINQNCSIKFPKFIY